MWLIWYVAVLLMIRLEPVDVFTHDYQHAGAVVGGLEDGLLAPAHNLDGLVKAEQHISRPSLRWEPC